MKRLYNEDDTYSDEAMKLDDETYIAIESIFDKYRKAGYSARQISHVMHASIIDKELVCALTSSKRSRRGGEG